MTNPLSQLPAGFLFPSDLIMENNWKADEKLAVQSFFLRAYMETGILQAQRELGVSEMPISGIWSGIKEEDKPAIIDKLISGEAPYTKEIRAQRIANFERRPKLHTILSQMESFWVYHFGKYVLKDTLKDLQEEDVVKKLNLLSKTEVEIVKTSAGFLCDEKTPIIRAEVYALLAYAKEKWPEPRNEDLKGLYERLKTVTDEEFPVCAHKVCETIHSYFKEKEPDQKPTEEHSPGYLEFGRRKPQL